MCGIAGIWRFDGGAVGESDLRQMTNLLAHRGPDDVGWWAEGPIGLGHCRLSIIDISGSRQPMATQDHRFVLTFNGEILNYRQLRAETPHPYRTDGDTEVLLAVLTQGGVGALDRLAGQFAFGLFDSQMQVLTLARDRLGILPLYYWIGHGMIAFASEVKALLPIIDERPSVDEAQLASYLTYRSVPSPDTLFNGIKKVSPGEWLRIDRQKRITSGRYWTVPVSTPDHVSASEAVELVDETFTRAVERALVADVGVGAYLSGGLDSSLTSAVATKLRGGEALETFSAGFADPRFDELPYASRVSQIIGSKHHPVVVGPDDFAKEWTRLTWHRDAPVSEPADVAVAQLAAEAKGTVKVLLSGEGSDELFAGYPKYRYARLVDLIARLSPGLRRIVFGSLAEALPARGRRLRTLLRVTALPSEAERTASWFAPFPPAQRQALFPEGVPVLPDTTSQGQGDDIIRRMLRADCGTWLSENLLERGDRMTMSSSVELRPPFLDRELVELAFALPSEFKVRRGVTKWVLKEVARRYLPNDLVDRRKVGFRVPLDVWMRGDLLDLVRDVLLDPDSFVLQAFEPAVVRGLVRAHVEGRSSEEGALFALLSLEIWHHTFIRSAGLSPGSVAST